MLRHTIEEVEELLRPRFVTTGFCGFHPPAGWADLLASLDARLAVLAPHYRIVQVKEKFGQLRFFVDGLPSPESRAVIEAAYALSSRVCQACGSADGAFPRREGGPVATLCDGCAASGSDRGYRYPDLPDAP